MENNWRDTISFNYIGCIFNSTYTAMVSSMVPCISLHLNRGDVRNAIIDLGIAVDYLVKRYIRDRVSMSDEAINKIFEKSSIGDLLTIAKILSRGDPGSTIWDKFEKLHGFRNEVLHDYRRRFGPSELKIIERSQNDILSLLRDLTVSSSIGEPLKQVICECS